MIKSEFGRLEHTDSLTMFSGLLQSSDYNTGEEDFQYSPFFFSGNRLLL